MSNELLGFLELNIADFLMRALQDLGFTQPTPVQAQAIPLLMQGRDMIAQAQTGTGKTAAFALPILQQLNPELQQTQALILSPTRELAIQIAEQMTAFSKYCRHINIAVLCGGQDYRPQLKQLRQGAQIVVGTPGRVLDHLSRHSLKLEHLTAFILDEADEMLRMGFIEDVETILEQLPKNKQMALFSATMPSRIRDIAQQYLNQPATVTIKSQTATAPAISQRFLFASPSQKPLALLRILASEERQGMIVFVKTKSASEEVAGILQEHGYSAVAIHGDLPQKSREKILNQFRQGITEILVATDVAARGLDVETVTHVINYDVPQSCETYVHRIGRTGRAGREGTSILFVTPKEGFLLNRIEQHTRQRIEKIQPPTDKMITEAKLKRFAAGIIKRLNHANFPHYQTMLKQFLQDQADISALDAAAALALMVNHDQPWDMNLPALSSHEGSGHSGPKRAAREREFDRDFQHKRHHDRDRYDHKEKRRDRSERSHSRAASDQVLYRLDVGRNHGVRPNNLVGAIANEGGISSRNITGLEIHGDYSTVYLPDNMPKKVFNDLSKAWVCGRQLKLSTMN